MWQIIIQVTGAVIFIAGLIFFPLPIPIGAVMIIIGLAMMISSSKKLRKTIRDFRRRNPKLNMSIHQAELYLPQSVKDSIDQTDPDTDDPDSDDPDSVEPDSVDSERDDVQADQSGEKK